MSSVHLTGDNARAPAVRQVVIPEGLQAAARTSSSAPWSSAPASAISPSSLPSSAASALLDTSTLAARVRVSGKFFELAGQRWYVKGLTYGPFAPNADGLFLPRREQTRADFKQIRDIGANCIRVYHRPPRWFLDEALEHDLRVFVDVPWEKHRCFFEDWSARQAARDEVRRTAQELGTHPGLFAISVANEFPSDIVRFYGRARVAHFVDELIDTVKQEAADCPATFANYPSTEFLRPTTGDFVCFNVYLECQQALSGYLDRLQHLAGSRPLILGEFGTDSFRHGEAAQMGAIVRHVEKVFHHGLAGSFVFSFTDDWYTGGHQIEDWAFGVTGRNRSPKPAAAALQRVWARAPHVVPTASLKVSVVVCSFNGAATLAECLSSLQALNYPDYEVILVDDGSTDDTRDIAADFPTVRYIHQENRGLSAARNVGAAAAVGDIVAYTDADCVADPNWLFYLVDAMRRQQVKAIGGPNLPPPQDNWTAKCVASSPGGPSHVMLDDQRAEHVPGCNMAFDRATLLALGGFDPQFRQAGDDVDICWRLLDAGIDIGYAAAAVVWHHRRSTVRAYLNQQKGYGRSEAMLIAKYPRRFNRLGASLWKGIIYGEGAIGLPLVAPIVYHGRFGAGLFQSIYTRNAYSTWGLFTQLEWHAAAVAFAMLALLLWPPLAILSLLMWALTLAAAWRTSRSSRLPSDRPWWCPPLVFALHIMQPVVRAWHRYRTYLGEKELPRAAVDLHDIEMHRLRRVGSRYDAYWTSDASRGREHLLEALEAEAHRVGWRGVFDEHWSEWDVMLMSDRWWTVHIATATEELGWPRRFTRARVTMVPTLLAWVCVGTFLTIAASVTVAIVAADARPWALLGIAATASAVLALLWGRRLHVLRAVAALLARAGRLAKLTPFTRPPSDAPAPDPCELSPAEAMPS